MNLHVKLFLNFFNIKISAYNTSPKIKWDFKQNIDFFSKFAYNNFRIIKTTVFVRTALRRRSIFLYHYLYINKQRFLCTILRLKKIMTFFHKIIPIYEVSFPFQKTFSKDIDTIFHLARYVLRHNNNP